MEAPNVHPKLKEALSRNRLILMKNIVICEELYEELLKLNVFPDNVTKEIKAAQSLEEKVDRMLDMLSLRGQASVLKFCDALQLSGHSFLADILRDELQEKPADPINLLEMMKRLPNNRLGKHWKDFKEEELSEVSSYINDKVRENVVKQLWLRDSQNKVKAMDAKQKQLEDSWIYAEQIKAKDEEIKELKGNVKLARRELEKKDDQISQYARIADQLKSSHQNEMETQMKYNVANDKAVQRTAEQLTETEQIVLEMKITMKEYFDELDPNSHLKRRDSDELYKDRSITTADKARDLLELLLERVRGLEFVEQAHGELVAEKGQALERLGAQERAGLLVAVANVLGNHEERVRELSAQRQRFADRIEQLLAVQESAGKLMHENISQLNVDLAAKEAQVKSLKDELMRLRNLMAYQEKKKGETASSKRPTTPRFKHFHDTGHTGEERQGTATPHSRAPPSEEHSASPASSDRRTVTFQRGEGSPRPPIRLALSRPHTQHSPVKPAASYPQPVNGVLSSYLPPLANQHALVRPQRGAPSIPVRGGRPAVDPFHLMKPSVQGREKITATETVALTHAMKSGNRKSARAGGPHMSATMQRQDTMAGYVSNGNAYKASNYRYG